MTQYTPTSAVYLQRGFGSYLSGILPSDIATACGAFRYSMLQIKNIRNIPITQFAQVVFTLETLKDLTINGTSVPVDTTLATAAHSAVSGGSGPLGTYTVSDFFGCMSGLPYNGIFNDIQNTMQDAVLANIYREMYLAISWAGASATVSATTSAVPDGLGGFDYFYQITGITLTGFGGGYGRGGAPAPIVVISGTSGATATVTGWNTTIDPTVINTFGKINGIQLTNAGVLTQYGNGPSSTPPPTGLTVAIEFPPDIVPGPIGTVLPSGYANTPSGTVGWPAMNTVIQDYIDQANNRIAAFATEFPEQSSNLNTAWNRIGTQLKTEQKSRFTGLYPLPTPKNTNTPIGVVPSTIISWVDALARYSTDTKPHMYAQTLEAIADWTTVGGQSIVGVMRQERNAARLQKSGIPLDNNIPITDQSITLANEKELIANDHSATLMVGPTTIGASPVVNTANAPFANVGLRNVGLGYYDRTTNKYVINGVQLDDGRASVPGSFASSQYIYLVEPSLNSVLASKQLTPSTYTVNEAVTEVQKCNCECWDQ